MTAPQSIHDRWATYERQQQNATFATFLADNPDLAGVTEADLAAAVAGKQDAATAATDAELAAAQASDDARLQAIEGDVMVVVKHGANANVARPAGAAAVFWVGTVEPVNMQIDTDLWPAP